MAAPIPVANPFRTRSQIVDHVLGSVLPAGAIPIPSLRFDRRHHVRVPKVDLNEANGLSVKVSTCAREFVAVERRVCD